MAFKVAASMGFKKAVEAAKPVLLEPIMSVEVVAPDDTLGAVIGDLNSRRGKVQGVVPQANGQAIKALVPMSEMLSYAPTLNSLTSGRGMYTMEFSGYEDVPSHLAQKIIQEHAAQQQAATTTERKIAVHHAASGTTAQRRRMPPSFVAVFLPTEREIHVQKRHPLKRHPGRVRNASQVALRLHRRLGKGRVPARAAGTGRRLAFHRTYVLQGHEEADRQGHRHRDGLHRRRDERLHLPGDDHLLCQGGGRASADRDRSAFRHPYRFPLRSGRDGEGAQGHPRRDQGRGGHARRLYPRAVHRHGLAGQFPGPAHPRDPGDDQGAEARRHHLLYRKLLQPPGDRDIRGRELRARPADRTPEQQLRQTLADRHSEKRGHARVSPRDVSVRKKQLEQVQICLGCKGLQLYP